MEGILLKTLWGLDPVKVMLGTFTFAWAVGFARYLDAVVYFPAFPNILDVLGLMVVGGFLLFDSAKDRLAGGRSRPSKDSPGKGRHS